MSFIDAILEKQKQEHSGGSSDAFPVLLKRVKLVEGETAVFCIRAIIDVETSYMQTEIMQASRPALVGKRVEMNINAPFLNEADHRFLNRFKVGGLITLKYTKRRSGDHIFIYDYRD